MPATTQTGVNQAVPAAGGQAPATEPQQQPFDVAALFNQDAGVNDEPAAAGQEGDSELEGQIDAGEDVEGQDGREGTEQIGTQPGTQQQFDQRTEQAFAKRLAAEREKLRRELEQQLTQQYGQPVLQQPAYGQPGMQQPYLQQPPANHIEELAMQWGTTPEVMRAMLDQQMRLNAMQERIEKAEIKEIIERQRQEKPFLPAFDEARLEQIREQYRRFYGTNLPWREAYRQLVIEEAFNGRLSTAAEQRAISQITQRNKATVQAGKGGQAKKPDIWDLPDEEFEKLVERAKAGELKKS